MPGLDYRIIQGDVRTALRELPDKSVHMCVTSPPYWSLRDYGTAQWEGGDAACDHKGHALASSKTGLRNDGREHTGLYDNEKKATAGMPYRDTCGKCGARRIDNQLGLEATPQEYIANMLDVFREVWRVLRDDGTLWLNLGDSYVAGPTGHQDISSSKGKAADMFAKGGRYRLDNYRKDLADTRQFGRLKPKDLVGIPWRLALALQDAGWYLRSDVIWHKLSAMPESVQDRPTSAHEHIFLLAKQERYYYDALAIAEPAKVGSNGSTFTNGKTAAPHSNVGQGPRNEQPALVNIRNVWGMPAQRWRLRSDLTPEQRAYVMRRICDAGYQAAGGNPESSNEHPDA